jgi:hypothetical protein
VTKSDLARRRGCTRQAATKAARAFPTDAFKLGLVDLEHPSVARWLANERHVTTRRNERVLECLERIALGLDRIATSLEQK